MDNFFDFLSMACGWILCRLVCKYYSKWNSFILSLFVAIVQAYITRTCFPFFFSGINPIYFSHKTKKIFFLPFEALFDFGKCLVSCFSLYSFCKNTIRIRFYVCVFYLHHFSNNNVMFPSSFLFQIMHISQRYNWIS